ncbi:hypothetical protein MXM24_05730 [Enterococcus gallinarum]|uniref:hypothetical protein n=1 Tax=Enterococcus gallinarum TaxID=1353 RepID=UPI002DB89437|nr:hypothetical protein [Enterococcus gallinarum]MEB6063301.1 hypothetical protein [Enterococcus gallinarum]
MEINHHNNKEKDTNHSVSVSGNATGVQIQQNVSNSTQSQAVNEVFEYEKVLEVLHEISNFQQMFKDTYGNEAEQVLDWNGNSFFDKFYKVQNFFPYAIPIVLDNEPPRM